MEGLIFFVGLMAFIFVVFVLPTMLLSPARKANSVLKKKGLRIKLAEDSEFIKIVGKIVDKGNTIESPIARKKCSYYEFEIKEKNDEGDYLSIFSHQYSSKFPLYMEDETGMAKFSFVNYVSRLNFETIAYSSNKYPFDEHTQGFLAKFGISSKGRELLYTEAIIAPGDKIAVCGYCKWISDPEVPGNRILSIRGKGDHALGISNLSEHLS